MGKLASGTALLLISLSLAGCNTSGGSTGSISGGSGGSGGGGSGGSGGSGGGGGSGGSGGSGGGIALYGLKSSYTKKLQIASVPAAGYELSEYFISDDPNTSGPTSTTGTLTLPNGQQVNSGSAKAETTAGTVDSSSGQVTPHPAYRRGFYTNDNDPDDYSKLDLLRVTSYDLDNDTADDFFVVEQHINYSSFTGPSETVATLYGGDIAPTSAIAGKNTATYKRSRSEGGGEFQYKSGPSTSQEGSTFSGNSTITADFDAGTVDATIDNTSRLFGTKGPSQVSVTMTGATLTGTQFSGGTVTLKDESNGNTISNFGTNSAYSGALLGPNAEHAGGVFQGNGSINDNATSMVKGWFVGDAVPPSP